MKIRIKKAFEGAAYWIGVMMIGLIVGVSVQFVRAWVSPSDNPPNGNVGAPINTESIGQWKKGALGALSFVTNVTEKLNGAYVPNSGLKIIPQDLNGNGVIDSDEDPTGKALVAVNSEGDVAFAAAGSSNSGSAYLDCSYIPAPASTSVDVSPYAYKYDDLITKYKGSSKYDNNQWMYVKISDDTSVGIISNEERDYTNNGGTGFGFMKITCIHPCDSDGNPVNGSSWWYHPRISIE